MQRRVAVLVVPVVVLSGMLVGCGQSAKVAGIEDLSGYGVQVVGDVSASYQDVVTGPASGGCSLGYWKNHVVAWPPTGFSPAQSVSSVFAGAAAYPTLGSSALLDALHFGGGAGVEGSAALLLKQAVAALLNASHPNVNYALSPAEVIASVNAALASGDRATMLALQASLDEFNTLDDCPFGDSAMTEMP